MIFRRMIATNVGRNNMTEAERVEQRTRRQAGGAKPQSNSRKELPSKTSLPVRTRQQLKLAAPLRAPLYVVRRYVLASSKIYAPPIAVAVPGTQDSHG